MDVHTHPLFHDPSAAGGPPLTPELVAAAEASLGVKLPTAYIEALRTCNGGELRRGFLASATPLTSIPGAVQAAPISPSTIAPKPTTYISPLPH